MALSNNDRELLLSKYIDHELTAEETVAVAEKIHSDPQWRADFEQMRQSDARVARTVRRFNGESPLAKQVVDRILSEPPPVRTKSPLAHPGRRKRHSARRRAVGSGWSWLSRVAGVAVIATASYFGWNYYNAPVPQVETAIAVPVQNIPNAASIVANPVLSDEIQLTQWPDGTMIWSRKGTEISSLGPRAVKLSGMAFFHVAPSSTPFVVTTGENRQTQALGTRFEITTVQGAARVRVAEGHVRVAVLKDSVDAFGGTEVQPDLSTRPFDPRVLAGEWSKLIAKSSKAVASINDNLVSPWAQAGGSPGHTGMTPLNGPERLGRDEFVALPGDVSRTVATAAIIGVGEQGSRAYVLARTNGDAKDNTILSLDLKSGAYAWKVCDKFRGYSECAPVVTPRGLLVYATAEGQVKAYEPSSGKIVWNAPGSDVFALTACANETVVCSTRNGLIALNGRDGQVLWKSAAILGVRAPVCALPNGTLCAVSEGGIIAVLDGQGHSIQTLSKKWGDSLLSAPVADGDGVWIGAHDGRLARMLLKDGTLQEKAYGRALTCGPLANGLVGVNSSIVDFAAPAPAEAHGEAIIALIQDGRGDHFIGYKNGVVHLRPGATSAREFIQIAHGDVLAGGLSVGSNVLLVTTTQGIQIFE